MYWLSVFLLFVCVCIHVWIHIWICVSIVNIYCVYMLGWAPYQYHIVVVIFCNRTSGHRDNFVISQYLVNTFKILIVILIHTVSRCSLNRYCIVILGLYFPALCTCIYICVFISSPCNIYLCCLYCWLPNISIHQFSFSQVQYSTVVCSICTWLQCTKHM